MGSLFCLALDCIPRDQIAFLSGSQPISVLENGQKSNFDHEEYSLVPDKTATLLYVGGSTCECDVLWPIDTYNMCAPLTRIILYVTYNM